MTAFGKSLVYFLTVGSLAMLGVCFWLYVDYQDLKTRQGLLDGAKKEVQQKLEAQVREQDALFAILTELKIGSRVIEVQEADPTNPLKAAGVKKIAVSQLKEEIAREEKDIAGLKEKAAALQADVLKIQDQMKEARVQTTAAINEQKRLREAIDAPKIDGVPQKAFRVQIAEARQAQEAAEGEQDALRPKLTNALAELAVLQKRQDQLTKRLEALKVSAAASGQ